MNNNFEKYENIPLPTHEDFKFIEDLKMPMEQLRISRKLNIIDKSNCTELIQTAISSLLRISGNGDIFDVNLKVNDKLSFEEYSVEISANCANIQANDSEGFRRAIYFLSDKLGANEVGLWNKKPFIKHRISRCFFGPTNRAPFFIDELDNDIDYYPDEYLNKLAYEGVNGLWLTMYFRDLPSSIFVNRPKNADKRLAKLQQVVSKCQKYGIKIYLFFSEPKAFIKDAKERIHYADNINDAKNHQELVGTNFHDNFYSFCTSHEAFYTYVRESVELIFKTVEGLGGIINIMVGEDNGSCITKKLQTETNENCPYCSKHEYADIFAEIAKVFAESMHKYSPNSEFLGWFYMPFQRDNSKLMREVVEISKKWPKDCGMIVNFESGGKSVQLDKDRVVLDYSLAYVGPSELFKGCTNNVEKMGAKLQVGCSHENASVPFIPVPSNLYYKYKFMHENKIYAAMQCWYFGNYPGTMNKAAGELSFEPFPKNEDEFLLQLAKLLWQENSQKMAEAWKLFSQAYRNFPANIAFGWYGPLHSCIVWPLYLFPQDKPIAPSWILNNFPKNSGDRVGEFLVYYHNLNEAIILCEKMRNLWKEGFDIIKDLKDSYKNNQARLADINLSEAILIQMESTCNMLNFYKLREDMIFNEKTENLVTMKEIVDKEIINTSRMIELCEMDSRFGYHPEAENYLFYPEKLKLRKELLKDLLKNDFPRFDINSKEILQYSGKEISGKKILCAKKGNALDWQDIPDVAKFTTYYDETNLYVKINGKIEKNINIEIEPCRLWVAFKVTLTTDNKVNVYDYIFVNAPNVTLEQNGDEKTIIIPLETFEGFYRKNNLMRMNIRTVDNKSCWVKNEDFWPPRLLHDTHPQNMGWFIFE